MKREMIENFFVKTKEKQKVQKEVKNNNDFESIEFIRFQIQDYIFSH